MPAGPTQTHRVKNLMSAIIAQNVAETGDEALDSVQRAAKTAIDNYLNLPVTENETYKFWKGYGQSGDIAQRCLSHLAQIYLTPAPTSTDVERQVQHLSDDLTLLTIFHL